jgi:hypothetical protein
VKTEDFYVSCDYNENWSVWLSGTPVDGYIGDLWVVGGSAIESETLSRYTLTRDSIKTRLSVGNIERNILDSLVRHVQKNLDNRKTC